MTITLEIPDSVASNLTRVSPEELSRQALEGFVLEAFLMDRISGPQGAEILQFSRLRWEQFLKDHDVLKNAYSVADLERDVATLRRLRIEGLLPIPE